MYTYITCARFDAFDEALDLRRRGDADRVSEHDLVRLELSAELRHVSGIDAPFEGRVDPGHVAELCGQLEADEVVLADTIGVATPTQVKRLVERVETSARDVGVHLHNTRNTGYANALAALEAGATVLDASVGGLGGCPYAPKA